MDSGGFDEHSQMYAGRRQLVFSAQLFKATESMHHIDEIFLWQNRIFLQYFDVQVAQVWAFQAVLTGQLTIKIRAMDCQDASMPRNVFVNNQIAMVVGNLLNKQYNSMLLGVNNLFSLHQAEVLTRYGLNYCFCHFLRSNLLLPPMPNATNEEVPTPLSAAVLLFFRNFQSQDELHAINLILGQSLAIAGNRGFLVSANTTSGQLPALSSSAAQQYAPLRLTELIPHRSEDANALRSNNPFASSAVIADKQARRLYAAIDGRRNLGDISANLGLDAKEVQRTLRLLLEQQRILLYEPGGQLVDSSQFITNL